MPPKTKKPEEFKASKHPILAFSKDQNVLGEPPKKKQPTRPVFETIMERMKKDRTLMNILVGPVKITKPTKAPPPSPSSPPPPPPSHTPPHTPPSTPFDEDELRVNVISIMRVILELTQMIKTRGVPFVMESGVYQILDSIHKKNILDIILVIRNREEMGTMSLDEKTKMYNDILPYFFSVSRTLELIRSLLNNNPTTRELFLSYGFTNEEELLLHYNILNNIITPMYFALETLREGGVIGLDLEKDLKRGKGKSKPKPKSKGKGIDIQKHLSKLGELHVPTYDPEQKKWVKASFTGPGTNLDERIDNYEELKKLKTLEDVSLNKYKFNTKPRNFVDAQASLHDVRYFIAERDGKDKKEVLALKHKADKLMEEALKIERVKKGITWQNKAEAVIIGNIIGAKRKLGLGNETKPKPKPKPKPKGKGKEKPKKK
jgi:hypothetical protein